MRDSPKGTAEAEPGVHLELVLSNWKNSKLIELLSVLWGSSEKIKYFKFGILYCKVLPVPTPSIQSAN